MKRFALVTIFLVSATLGADAQGYPTGIRSGTAGPQPTTSTSPSSSSPYATPAPRNTGTGQTRSEGALGMTPQLQRELGIGKQQ